ncbi:hypothetical protein KUCAC02_019949 [Chaenocephalus aceratus]|uniref:Uncharacterized protein n=1 Tax=Chaenocephalus aceratus TaxID=36190 RepID=A0ACB9VRA1_CHAAC|nr:hypothetical protein KUCAC02_019949 [Chaenocephalus aceratus]
MDLSRRGEGPGRRMKVALVSEVGLMSEGVGSMKRRMKVVLEMERREEGLREVVGGGQENTGLLLLPLRQRSASCSHLPVRALLWAANQNDGQRLPDGGED